GSSRSPCRPAADWSSPCSCSTTQGSINSRSAAPPRPPPALMTSDSRRPATSTPTASWTSSTATGSWPRWGPCAATPATWPGPTPAGGGRSPAGARQLFDPTFGFVPGRSLAAPPVPLTFDLERASDTAPVGDGQTFFGRVTLLGHATPLAALR